MEDVINGFFLLNEFHSTLFVHQHHGTVRQDKRRLENIAVTADISKLNNIANRLRLIYHGRADISAEMDREGRTAVTLRVPQEERTR